MAFLSSLQTLACICLSDNQNLVSMTKRSANIIIIVTADDHLPDVS